MQQIGSVKFPGSLLWLPQPRLSDNSTVPEWAKRKLVILYDNGLIKNL